MSERRRSHRSGRSLVEGWFYLLTCLVWIAGGMSFVIGMGLIWWVAR